MDHSALYASCQGSFASQLFPLPRCVTPCEGNEKIPVPKTLGHSFGPVDDLGFWNEMEHRSSCCPFLKLFGRSESLLTSFRTGIILLCFDWTCISDWPGITDPLYLGSLLSLDGREALFARNIDNFPISQPPLHWSCRSPWVLEWDGATGRLSSSRSALSGKTFFAKFSRWPNPALLRFEPVFSMGQASLG